MIRWLGLIWMILSVAAPSAAHTGFILPQSFNLPEPGTVTMHASFSDTFPMIEKSLQSPDFVLQKPDGQTDRFKRIEAFASMTVLESDLTSPGTYLASSGERLGRKAEVYREKEKFIRLELGEAPPPGRESISSQAVTVSEAYITVGEPAPLSALKPRGRLSVHPQTHPNLLQGRSDFIVDILFDGAPMRVVEAQLVHAFDHYSGAKEGKSLKPDTRGRIEMKNLKPGLYVLLVRHIAPAPEGSDTVVRSYSTTLTFEVRSKARP